MDPPEQTDMKYHHSYMHFQSIRCTIYAYDID
jgi:hypothetical protein